MKDISVSLKKNSTNKDQNSQTKNQKVSTDKNQTSLDQDEKIAVEDEISTNNRLENLSKLNKQLGELAEKYSQQDLNGLLLLGTTGKFVSKTIEPLLESNDRTQLSQNAIKNLESLMGDRFNGNNDKSFTWKGKETVEWSVVHNDDEKKLIGLSVDKQKHKIKVFEAIQSQPNSHWHTVESKLTDKQLISLAQAEKSKPRKVPEKSQSQSQLKSKQLSRQR